MHPSRTACRTIAAHYLCILRRARRAGQHAAAAEALNTYWRWKHAACDAGMRESLRAAQLA